MAVERDLKGSFKGDVGIDVYVDVDIDRYFRCLKFVAKSVQVMFDGIEALMVLTLILLK